MADASIYTTKMELECFLLDELGLDAQPYLHEMAEIDDLNHLRLFIYSMMGRIDVKHRMLLKNKWADIFAR